MLKKIVLTSIMSASLTVFATSSIGGEMLPDGNYQMSAVDKDGNQIGNVANFDIPLNAPSYVAGILCLNPGVVGVAIEQMGDIIKVANCPK
jgi:hypothetical protein